MINIIKRKIYFRYKPRQENLLDIMCYNGETYPINYALKTKYDLEYKQYVLIQKNLYSNIDTTMLWDI